MGDCCTCNNEISRDGSGQLGRYLKALDPSYAPVDDRSIEELLVFTKAYANQIRFYDIPDSNIPGDEDKTKISWREFFTRDMAVIAASISQTDIEEIKTGYDAMRSQLDANPTAAIFGDLFKPILDMAAKIDGWFALAIPGNPLYADIQLAIISNLKTQAQKIVAYEKGFAIVDSQHPLNLDYSKINKDTWGLNDTINADTSIYQAADTANKIYNAALYVDDVFNSFYGFINQLITNSEKYMQFALEQYPSHQPHMALFIAFLQLFKLVQDQANGITQRMLDFYYRDVLHLAAKPSIPDKVNIVFELAKDVTEYDIALGTPLKAGKDSSGKDQIYTTETDLVVNQAKVKEIKNLFIDKKVTTDATTQVSTTIINSIYARPIANSQDGLGAKFTDPNNTKWLTFGKGNAATTSNNICDQIAATDDTANNQAQIGFAIASPQLVLQGGNRLVQLHINGLSNLLNNDQKNFEIWLTADSGWLKINNSWFSKNTNNKSFEEFQQFIDDTITNEIFNLPTDLATLDNGFFVSNDTLYIYLPIAAPAIIPYDAKLHPGSSYITSNPVLQVLIDGDYNNDLSIITTLSISTKVGSINPKNSETLAPITDGLKKLTLQNEQGAIAAGKPFDPFTAYPITGNSFYIGSNEVFNKPLAELAINIKHVIPGIDDVLDAVESERNSKAEIYQVNLREKKQWLNLSTADGTDFTEGDLTTNILFTPQISADGATAASPHSVDRLPISYPTEFNEDVYKGFIEIVNNFSVSRKQGDYLNSAAAQANDYQLISKLAPFFKIKEISLSYQSILQPLNSEIDQLFHIYPFGVVETYLSTPVSVPINAEDDFSTLDEAKDYLLVDANNALLPQFNYISPYAKYYADATSPATITSSTSPNGLVSTKTINATINLNKNARGYNAARLLLDANNNAENSTNQYVGDLQQGSLYIGLEQLQPLQSISMLFQFAEGSAEDEDDDPPTINWCYLSNNEWKPLKAENIVSDGTYGFQTTGIIKIDVPEDASTHNTIITDGLLWFSAGVTENADRIPQLIDIITQAIEAQFHDNGNAQSHFDAALPAGSISKLSVPVAQVSKVQQPFASFDGKHQEVGKEFYTRVSERLRHKQRAITAWDYEHLVLDRFPSIYKVKCITHTDPNCLCRTKTIASNSEKTFLLSYTLNADLQPSLTPASNQVITLVKNEISNDASLAITTAVFGTFTNSKINPPELLAQINAILAQSTFPPATNIDSTISDQIIKITLSNYEVVSEDDCCGSQVSPGHVLLIPIADLKNRNAANPLQPKTSRMTLIAIQEYLKTLVSPFVHVYAKNPLYEQVIISFKVQFYSGTHKGYYMKKLNDEIVQFLTPWAFDANAEVFFDQKIYASSIINFIEERTYVDFITDFVMGVCCNDCCLPSNAVGVTDISVNVYDNNKDDVKKLIGDVVVKIKELNESAVTVKDVPTVIKDIPAGTFTMLIYFSLFDIITQKFTVDKNGNVSFDMRDANTPGSFDFYRSAENEQTDVANFFSQVCGCNEIEWFLKSDPGFEGDIVAEPCTSRSILVSAPHHIIVPYIPPIETSCCDTTTATSANSLSSKSIAPSATKIAMPVKSLPAKEETKKITSNKLATAKKVVEAHHVKPEAKSVAKKTAAPKAAAKHKKPK